MLLSFGRLLGGSNVNKLTLYTAGLIVMAVALPCTAKELTLEEAIRAWSFMEGNWTLKSPEGQVFDVNVRLAPTKTAYISESQQGLHVFGWDPKKKLLEVQSFMPDSSRAIAFYERKSDKELVNTETRIINAEGKESTLSNAGVFTVVDDNTWTIAFGGAIWTAKRKPVK
jgi:hypothetical protein